MRVFGSPGAEDPHRKTLLLVLLGNPVGHSRSPAIQQAALDHLGIRGRYQARSAGVEELEETVTLLRTGGIDGANVTMPLKQEAAARCDLLTTEAEAAGSVNTLRARQGRVEGHSTDVVAMRQALASELFDPDAPLLLLGAGGAAGAAASSVGSRPVHVSARNENRARRLAARIGRPDQVVPFGSPLDGAIVVNATPIGMGGETLPGRVLARASGLIDLAYGETVTGSVRWAEAHGLPYLDGVEFLVLQAGASFEWWTGRPAPRQVMLEAARNA